VCSSPDPRDRRLRPSAAIAWEGAVVLVDTSPDLREQVLRYGVSRVDAVLYTHAHADHLLGLDDLRLFNWRQRGAVPAFGSPETLDAVRRTFWYVFDPRPIESTRPLVDCRTVDGPFDVLGRAVQPVPVMHGSLPILGYRIGALAYLTDASRIPEASYALLGGLELLVINALRERPHPMHLTIDEALAEASRIAARRTILTHVAHDLSHREIARRLPPAIELGYDGLEIELPEG
jgi:phosphoribosyl 1,2-cyclic phosphate phosphodiesterase